MANDFPALLYLEEAVGIISELLPTLPKTILPFARRADLALGFNPFHTQVRSNLHEMSHAERRRSSGTAIPVPKRGGSNK